MNAQSPDYESRISAALDWWCVDGTNIMGWPKAPSRQTLPAQSMTVWAICNHGRGRAQCGIGLRRNGPKPVGLPHILGESFAWARLAGGGPVGRGVRLWARGSFRTGNARSPGLWQVPTVIVGFGSSTQGQDMLKHGHQTMRDEDDYDGCGALANLRRWFIIFAACEGNNSGFFIPRLAIFKKMCIGVG